MANPVGNPAWQKGVSGNPLGRPYHPSVVLFREALSKVEIEKKMTLFEHAARVAFKDNQVLIAILKKILPDLTDVLVNSDSNIKIDEGLREFIGTIFNRIPIKAELCSSKPADGQSGTVTGDQAPGVSK